MPRFFNDIDSINLFTQSLDCHIDSLTCEKCSRNNQFVSHGYIYKQRSQSTTEAVGKRLFCSNRYGRSGCGKTLRLTIANEIPNLCYSGAQVFIFLTQLLAGNSVQHAYQQATRQFEARNAWRWLNKLTAKLTVFRSVFISRAPEHCAPNSSHSRRRRILLPTIEHLCDRFNPSPCSAYQLHTQSAFL